MSDAIDPRTVELLQRGDWDKARWCEEVGDHDWSHTPDEWQEYRCEVCGATGTLVRPMGARRA